MRPNQPILDPRSTFTDPPKRMAVRVHLRSEIGRFGLIVRVGGPLSMASRHTPTHPLTLTLEVLVVSGISTISSGREHFPELSQLG